MSNKIALLIFAVTVLLASSVIVAIPQANALTKSNVMRYISTASYGNSVVCGDHKCAPGEHTKWVNAIWQAQKVSYGKIGSEEHGEDVMKSLSNSTMAETPSHGNATMSGNPQTPMTGYR